MDVEKIAKGLSEAQRRAVRQLSENWRPWRNQGISSAHYLSGFLTEKRFAGKGQSTHCQYRLTPLGLAVREYLEKSDGG